MKILRIIARLLIGLTFIFSGLTKLMDPAGTALKIGEYLGIIGAAPWALIYVVFAVLLSSVELIMGFALLLGLRVRFFSKLALIFLIFFTLLTFYIALFNPVSDCGCFGDVLHLTNWQTFFKNIILLAFILLLFFQRLKFTPILPERWEWVVTLTFFVFFISLSAYSYIHLPQVDLMEYRVGSDLRELSGLYENNTAGVVETILIYEKDGIEYEFTIENLPDSSYTFVDSKTIGTESLLSRADFALSNGSGYVTDSVLNTKGAFFLVTIPFVDFLSKKNTNRIIEFCDSLHDNSVPLFVVTGSGEQSVRDWVDEHGFPYEVYYGDYKMIFTLNRSFGGVTYVNDGTIISKWSRADLPFGEINRILEEDPEVLATEEIIRQTLFQEFIFALLLVVAAVLRFSFKILYKHDNNENREK